MEKKKILFLMHHMWHGGTEKALLSLLSVIDYKNYDVTLQILQYDGAEIANVPSEVHVSQIPIPESEKGILCGKRKQIKSLIRSGHFIKAVSQFRYNRRFSITEDRNSHVAYYNSIAEKIPCSQENYDLAIDFFGYQTFSTYYLAEKVRSRAKISWLHGIMQRDNLIPYKEYYEKIDRIYACSVPVKQSFDECFPQMGKCSVFYNIIQPETIRNKALSGETYDDEYKGIRILTVGRVSPEKGVDIAINAYKKLLKEGLNIRWYWVGPIDEAYYTKIEAFLENQQEKDNFVFYGHSDNPYRFMQDCDIYVQPSYTEGYCTASNEARMLCCPVIRTATADASDQFSHRINGSIVSIDSDAVYDEIKYLICHPEVRQSYRDALKDVDFDTTKEIEKLYELME